ncbi:MAG TPA: FAD-dependent oxidoreductase [Flavitalea sp.]|nr:FAD-dependent oxidoreductase [Flavitalea sp.]
MFNRDATSKSLWQGTAETYKPVNTADPQTVYDVVIVGGGITGVSIGLALQKKGKNCLILEAESLCYGTTGGTTAHINTLLDNPYSTIEKKFSQKAAHTVANATKDALALIKNNIQEYRIDCAYSDAEAFLFAQDEKQEKELDEIFQASESAGLTVRYTDTIDVPIEFRKAMIVEGQGRFHPVKYVHGLATAFESLGGVIVEHSRVVNVEDGEPVVVETERYKYKGSSLIYATHIPPGINLLHMRCSANRSYAMAVTLSDDKYPTRLSYDMYEPYHYYRTQEWKGKKYLIVGGEDHKTGDHPNTGENFLALESHVKTYFKIKSIEYKWSSQYFEPADGLPYIGQLPGHSDHIFVATGFGGNGMTFSSVASIIFSKWLGDNLIPYDNLFNPNRIKPIAGFVSFLSNNATVIQNFFGKMIPSEKLSVLSGIAQGEGEIVKFEDQKIALYRDDYGKLFALNPTCTHMKCDVKWNQTERSWDCPCHGARYSPEGRVLTGPADHGLTVIDLETIMEQSK